MMQRIESKIKKKMNCRYVSNHDLCQYLSGTIVRYKGLPYMFEVDEDNYAHLYDMVTGEPKVEKIRPDDADLDISSPDLGYMNVETGVQYVYRNTARYYKQGICNYNIKFSGIDGKNNYPGSINSKWLKACLLGDYPSLDVALKIITDPDDKRNEIAISRDVALQYRDSGIILIYLKAKEVASFSVNTKKVSLPTSELTWILERYLNQSGLET